ncbi:MAG: NapC/NirT family cytochrome c [Rhodospirillum sp.]|nr:NapC/NirT family cytochrome c [Rhodospirillum sp.]MCF8490891.1 NapC/NirT family cytochrome c [Rhodospirillum sp.]MCF8499931.1 NapC/NirT family cytochrome c [Rhodospirillum sp.]
MKRPVLSWLTRPSRRGAFVILCVGAVVALIGWGGFHAALDATNTETFCLSCHEMKDTVYQEYLTTAHARNPSGVRATCPDCHVPTALGPKLLRKIQASTELYHAVMGTIDTPEKFEARRIDMAEHVWSQLEATDSRECRSCHSFDAMDFHGQTAEGAKRMAEAKDKGETCIGCHKGIAHKMPDLAGRARERAVAFMARTESLEAPRLWTKRTSALRAEPGAEAEKLAAILPGVSVTRLARDGDFVKVRSSGWRAGDSLRGQYAAFGKRILNLSIASDAVERVTLGESRYYADGDQDWVESALEGWLPAADLTADVDMLWTVAGDTYTSQCGVCHSVHVPDSRGILAWQADVQAYQPKTSLSPEETRLVLRYLQTHAADMPPVGAGS